MIIYIKTRNRKREHALAAATVVLIILKDLKATARNAVAFLVMRNNENS